MRVLITEEDGELFAACGGFSCEARRCSRSTCVFLTRIIYITITYIGRIGHRSVHSDVQGDRSSRLKSALLPLPLVVDDLFIAQHGAVIAKSSSQPALTITLEIPPERGNKSFN